MRVHYRGSRFSQIGEIVGRDKKRVHYRGSRFSQIGEIVGGDKKRVHYRGSRFSQVEDLNIIIQYLKLFYILGFFASKIFCTQTTFLHRLE